MLCLVLADVYSMKTTNEYPAAAVIRAIVAAENFRQTQTTHVEQVGDLTINWKLPIKGEK